MYLESLMEVLYLDHAAKLYNAASTILLESPSRDPLSWNCVDAMAL